MKAVVAAFNQEKALVGAFSVIVQLVMKPIDRFTALIITIITASTSAGTHNISPFIVVAWDEKFTCSYSYVMTYYVH